MTKPLKQREIKRRLSNLRWIPIDGILLSASFFATLLICCNLNFESEAFNRGKELFYCYGLYYILCSLLVFAVCGIYGTIWRYASIREFGFLIFVSFLHIVILDLLLFFTLGMSSLPLGVYVLLFFANIAFLITPRLAFRLLRLIQHLVSGRNIKKQGVPTMIVGAGFAGKKLLTEITHYHKINIKPVCFIDDDSNKHGKNLDGLRVYGGRDKIAEAVSRFGIKNIIINMPSATEDERKVIIETCTPTGCKLMMVPSLGDILENKVSINRLRDVEITDLLGRKETKLDLAQVSDFLQGKVIIVSGGGGSIGSELCRQIANFNPKLLIVFDIYENNAYDLQQELKVVKPDLPIKVLIGSVRDIDRLDEIFAAYRPEVVFHAAAHKHVPLMEDSPKEAIKNNVFGTYNMGLTAKKWQAKRFILISTDKAVNPTNVMGASKRLCEMVIQSLNKSGETEFAAVRFGNVLGSNGSVIPLFKRQIAAGRPITVTHPDIVRYFMTIPEASQLVLQAGAMAKGGEIFILDMGQPVKIVALAENLIRLSGLEPYKDINIEFCGLRPGEKLYEELNLAEEGQDSTTHEKIFISYQLAFDGEKLLNEQLPVFKEIVLINDGTRLRDYLKTIVTTYKTVD